LAQHLYAVKSYTFANKRLWLAVSTLALREYYKNNETWALRVISALHLRLN